MKQIHIPKIIYITGLIFLLSPLLVEAVNSSSSNYQLENPSFSGGGGARNSATYSSQDAANNPNGTSDSVNYKFQAGVIPPIFPGVPDVPTLTNTGGAMYSTLDFIIATGGNANDVTYAIAISDDNFVTTYYVQSNSTIGSTAVWQTFTNWGGATGQRLVQLAPNVTYKIKVKARLGVNAESGYSNIATASTINPTLTVTIAGVSNGSTIAGATTNIATDSSGINFGSLQVGSIRIGAHTITVSTNANSGYTTKVFQDHDLVKTNGVTIPPLSATNAGPAIWPGAITDARFGYHTTDSSLCTGTANRFASNDTYAKLEITAYEVACSSISVSNDQTSVVYKVETEGLQPPGEYQNKISYITTAQY